MLKEDVISVVEKYYKSIIHDFSVVNAAAMAKSSKLTFKRKNFTEDIENFEYIKNKLSDFSKVLDILETEDKDDEDSIKTKDLLNKNMLALDDVLENSIDYFDCMDRIRRKEEVSIKENKAKLQKLKSVMNDFRISLGELDQSYQVLVPNEDLEE
ncbi:MAG TPA: hypothetical protein VJ916_01110 [Anaerovoracaceae bacterium]|nr:hypothetical protein [Anaerovoracaceae bacterium]